MRSQIGQILNRDRKAQFLFSGILLKRVYPSAKLLFVVSHSDREDHTRIISDRRATRQEKRFYEEGS